MKKIRIACLVILVVTLGISSYQSYKAEEQYDQLKKVLACITKLQQLTVDEFELFIGEVCAVLKRPASCNFTEAEMKTAVQTWVNKCAGEVQ